MFDSLSPEGRRFRSNTLCGVQVVTSLDCGAKSGPGTCTATRVHLTTLRFRTVFTDDG